MHKKIDAILISLEKVFTTAEIGAEIDLAIKKAEKQVQKLTKNDNRN